MTTATREPRKATRTCPMDDPDVLLMLKVRDDDEQAFDELMNRYHHRVIGHFIRTFGSRQDSEDLTQEVFLRLYRSRKTYTPRAKFITWLFHITHNVARNAIRSRHRKPCIYLDPVADNAEGNLFDDLLFEQGEEDPSRPVERDEIKHVVRHAVSTLASRQRRAVELHQFKGRTYSEVAEKMQMTTEAAKSLLYRARNQLRDTLAFYMESS